MPLSLSINAMTEVRRGPWKAEGLAHDLSDDLRHLSSLLRTMYSAYNGELSAAICFFKMGVFTVLNKMARNAKVVKNNGSLRVLRRILLRADYI